MKIQAKIQKWGNSLAIRIAGVMRDIPHFQEGMLIDIDVSEEGLNIRKLQAKKKLILPFNETELLKDMTPLSAHADLLSPLLKGEY